MNALQLFFLGAWSGLLVMFVVCRVRWKRKRRRDEAWIYACWEHMADRPPTRQLLYERHLR